MVSIKSDPVRVDSINTLRPWQNGRHFADDIFKCIFFNENSWISNKMSMNYVCWSLIDNMAALVQIMAWRRRGDKPNLNQWLLIYWRIHASLGLNELNTRKNIANAHWWRGYICMIYIYIYIYWINSSISLAVSYYLQYMCGINTMTACGSTTEIVFAVYVRLAGWLQTAASFSVQRNLYPMQSPNRHDANYITNITHPSSDVDCY